MYEYKKGYNNLSITLIIVTLNYGCYIKAFSIYLYLFVNCFTLISGKGAVADN